eukprot:43242-Prymnesium_polylepis.1
MSSITRLRACMVSTVHHTHVHTVTVYADDERGGPRNVADAHQVTERAALRPPQPGVPQHRTHKKTNRPAHGG